MSSVIELPIYAPPVCQDCNDKLKRAPDGAWTICDDSVLIVVETHYNHDSPWLTRNVLLSKRIPVDVAKALRDGPMIR